VIAARNVFDCFGSKAPFRTSVDHVRSTPNSRHAAASFNGIGHKQTYLPYGGIRPTAHHVAAAQSCSIRAVVITRTKRTTSEPTCEHPARSFCSSLIAHFAYTNLTSIAGFAQTITRPSVCLLTKVRCRRLKPNQSIRRQAADASLTEGMRNMRRPYGAARKLTVAGVVCCAQTAELRISALKEARTEIDTIGHGQQ